MTPSFGKRLQNNKYILQEEIKRGISGVTYKAFKTATKEEVTIKTLNSAIGQDSYLEELRKKSFDEARRLVRCSHPNIIRFRDFFVEEERPYIVMDAIRGFTLDLIVFPDNPLPEDVAVNCMRQIGEAVKVIHASGLLHRDIRPENIMLREGGQQVVLIDFGIAREFKAGSVQTHTHITSDYAPLEQHLPRAKRSQATDVYGLAATLYTLLLAKVPVSATLRDRIPLSAPRDLKPKLSPEVSVAVMKGMILEAEDRPSNVDEWLAMLPPVQNKNFTINIPEGLIEPERSGEVDPEPDRIPSEVKTSNSNFSQYIKIALALIAGFVIFDYAIIKFSPKNPQPEQTPNSEIVPIQTQFKA